MTTDWIIPACVVAVTIVAMEIVAWAVHKHVMHRWGWGWHRSHHAPGDGLLEKNDLYALVFGVFSLAFFTFAASAFPILYWVGAGMAAYGLLYFLLHDGLVHGRIGFRRTPRARYLKRLVQAHRLHHAVRERDGAVSFGFLYAPPLARLRNELKAARRPRSPAGE